MGKLLYTVDEACAVLGVGKTWLYEKMHDGELEYVVIGRSRRRIPAEALETLVARLRGVELESSLAG